MARRVIEAIESRVTLVLSLIIIALMLMPPQLAGWLADRTPPIVSFIKTEALNSPIAPGDALIVRIWRDKIRDDCPVTSTRYAVSQDGVTVDIEDGQWGGGPAGGEYFDFAYPTGHAMPPGNYELRVHLSYQCPNVAEPFQYEQPATLFRVRDERAKSNKTEVTE